MITGMIIGYFAKGVFDLVFLKLFGKIIPMDWEVSFRAIGFKSKYCRTLSVRALHFRFSP